MSPDTSRTRRPRRTAALASAAALACALTAAAGAATGASAATASCPWVHSTAPIATRVSQLLGQMTLDDKIAMVDGVGYANGTTGYVGHIAANAALCIPGLNLEDGPQGVADGVPGVTQLPAPVALAAAWDPALAREYGTVVGSEERGKGADVNLGPTVNIVRDPRWGRAFESYGEDPYLAGQTAVGYIDGVQSQGVLSQVKHFAVYNQETNRNTAADDAIVSPRAMHEIYFPQFQAAVQQAKAASVMCSYSTVNGQYACQNTYLMNVLDNEWHFPGFVTSDWGATHSTVPSALAGLDMNMPGGALRRHRLLRRATEGGGAGRAGAAVGAGRHGVADPDRDVPVQPVRQPADRVADRHRDHPGARADRPGRGRGRHRAAAERGGVLPLPRGRGQERRGHRADGGQYALTSGGGSAGVIAPYTVTPYQGISKRGAASGVSVSYAQGNLPGTGALRRCRRRRSRPG